MKEEGFVGLLTRISEAPGKLASLARGGQERFMTAIPADASGCRTNSLSSSVVSDPKGAIVVYRAVCVEMRPPGSFSFVVRFTSTFFVE